MPHSAATATLPLQLAGSDQARPLRCLWLARDQPYPLDTGTKVYSANLAASLAAAGAQVRFLGLGTATPVTTAGGGIDWLPVPGSRRSPLAAPWSGLPVAAAIDATPDYQRLLAAELHKAWEVVVFDSYGSGWALQQCLRSLRTRRAPRPVLVHVSHNHESQLWADMAREADCSPLRRFALRRNAVRVARLERTLLQAVDLVTTITDEDGEAFLAHRPARPMLTLRPGYSGWVAPDRRLGAATPRRVLLMGSFNWVVKQENLRRLVAVADPVFARENIVLDVVGDVPAGLLDALTPVCRATRFHGYVHDAAAFFSNARMALVPELIGGGFKLKFLDYFFGRVPVATLTGAATGLPPSLRAETLQCDDLESLVAAVVARIDCHDFLNGLQQRAYDRAQGEFCWEDRGLRLRSAIDELQRQGAATGTALPPAIASSLPAS